MGRSKCLFLLLALVFSAGFAQTTCTYPNVQCGTSCCQSGQTCCYEKNICVNNYAECCTLKGGTWLSADSSCCGAGYDKCCPSSTGTGTCVSPFICDSYSRCSCQDNGMVCGTGCCAAGQTCCNNQCCEAGKICCYVEGQGSTCKTAEDCCVAGGKKWDSARKMCCDDTSCYCIYTSYCGAACCSEGQYCSYSLNKCVSSSQEECTLMGGTWRDNRCYGTGGNTCINDATCVSPFVCDASSSTYTWCKCPNNGMQCGTNCCPSGQACCDLNGGKVCKSGWQECECLQKGGTWNGTACCGIKNQPCCSGSTCANGFSCDTAVNLCLCFVGRVEPVYQEYSSTSGSVEKCCLTGQVEGLPGNQVCCGAEGLPCCKTLTPQCFEGLTCSGGTCVNQTATHSMWACNSEATSAAQMAAACIQTGAAAVGAGCPTGYTFCADNRNNPNAGLWSNGILCCNPSTTECVSGQCVAKLPICIIGTSCPSSTCTMSSDRVCCGGKVEYSAGCPYCCDGRCSSTPCAVVLPTCIIGTSCPNSTCTMSSDRVCCGGTVQYSAMCTCNATKPAAKQCLDGPKEWLCNATASPPRWEDPCPGYMCFECPLPSSWSGCTNRQQTRTNYNCSSATNYSCVSFVETRQCEVEQGVGYLIRNMTGHIGAIYGILADGSYIYSASQDRTVKVWNKTNGGLVRTLEGHTKAVHTILQDNAHIYSASADNIIRVWNKGTFELLTAFTHADAPPANCLWTMALDGGRIYAHYCVDNKMIIWNATDGFILKTIALSGTVHRPFFVAVDENYIYVSPDGKKISALNKSTGELVRDFEGHEYDLLSVAFDRDYIYSSSSDNAVKIWRKSDGSLVRTLNHTSGVPQVAVDGDYVYSASYDKTLKVWKKSDGSLVRTFNCPNLVSKLVVDDDYIYAGSFNAGTIKVWRKSDGSLTGNLVGHTSGPGVILPDGDYVYSDSAGTIKVWSLLSCGAQNQACCAGGACSPGLSCINGVCGAGRCPVCPARVEEQCNASGKFRSINYVCNSTTNYTCREKVEVWDCVFTPPTACGNGVCNSGETCVTCPADCTCQGGTICDAATGACCSPACARDSDCDDRNNCTTDTCLSPGTCRALCSYRNLPVACSSDADCDDGNINTVDTCVNAGTCESGCYWGAAGQCSTDADCGDGLACTVDKCVCAPGACVHVATAGCEGGDVCAPIGTRRAVGGDSSFCNTEGGWERQKGAGSGCSQNYECLDNFCENRRCRSISELTKMSADMAAILSLLKKILALFGVR